MAHFFAAGGTFMWPIALVGIGVIAMTAKKAVELFGPYETTSQERHKGVTLVYQLGMIAFFTGALAQATGIVFALQAIQRADDVSPAIIMGGLEVSFYAPIFGLIVLIVSLICWAVLRCRADVLDVVEN